jgi:hypothetical protein
MKQAGTLDPNDTNLIDRRVWRKRPETATIRGDKSNLYPGTAASTSNAGNALQSKMASRAALENYPGATTHGIHGKRPGSSLTYASQNTKSSYSKNLRQRNMLERENT